LGLFSIEIPGFSVLKCYLPMTKVKPVWLCFGMVQILGFSGNSTDRPRASTVEVLSVAGPIAGSETLEAVPAQHV
jgi:hypothetical protein